MKTKPDAKPHQSEALYKLSALHIFTYSTLVISTIVGILQRDWLAVAMVPVLGLCFVTLFRLVDEILGNK